MTRLPIEEHAYYCIIYETVNKAIHGVQNELAGNPEKVRGIEILPEAVSVEGIHVVLDKRSDFIV